MAKNDKKQEFANRLSLACDHARIPPLNKGRQEALKKLLRVSQEAVRRWLAGESVPRYERVIELAEILGVNANWLLFDSGAMTDQTAVKTDGAMVNALIPWESAPSAKRPFELTMPDTSMICADGRDRSFFKGDILEFEPFSGKPEPEEFYLYLLDESPRPVFGQHYEDSDGFKIHFLSDSRADLHVNDSRPGKVIARLIGSRFETKYKI